MQTIPEFIIKKPRRKKKTNLEDKTTQWKLGDYLNKGSFEIGEQIVCPFCMYTGVKSKKGSAKIYGNEDDGMIFKCFSCHEVRKVK